MSSDSGTPTSSARKAVSEVARIFGPGGPSLWTRTIIWSTIGWSLLHSDRRPSYFVLGYPKTGTNWLCKMLAGYLGIPVYEFWQSPWPRFSRCVIHMHRFLPLARARRRTLYVMRDGRDIVVSDYHHRMRELAGNPALRAELEQHLGRGFDPDAIALNLPAFIGYLRSRRDSSVDYVSHVREALSHDYVRVRYEDLLEEASAALEPALLELTGRPVDTARLTEAVEAQSFERLTGREPGTEDRGSFLRKGVAGDWQSVFNRSAAHIYDEYAGDTLVECGYEHDRSWVERCPE